MNIKSIVERAGGKSLVGSIIAAATSYYVDSKALINDEEFDYLVDELRNSNPDHPVLSMTGWGAQSTDWDVPHWSFTGGLGQIKYKDMDHGKSTCSIGSAKLDGLTGVARYQNGQLIDVLTRGDGEFGKDITAMAMATNLVPATIDCADRLEVRGEFVISWEGFQHMIDCDLSRADTHPRNVAAGAMNGSDTAKAFYVDFVAFSMVNHEVDNEKSLDHFTKSIELLDMLGFQVVDYMWMTEHSDLGDEWESWKPNSGYKYPTDGIVMLSREDDKSLSQFKIKFEQEEFAVMEVHVTLRTTRTGRVIPHCNFKEPAFISGANIFNCTLNNIEWCRTRFASPIQVDLIEVDGDGRELVTVQAGQNHLFIKGNYEGWVASQCSGSDKDPGFGVTLEKHTDGEWLIKDLEPNYLPIWTGAKVKVRRANMIIPEIFEVVKTAEVPADIDIAESLKLRNWELKGADIIDLDARDSEEQPFFNVIEYNAVKGAGGDIQNKIAKVLSTRNAIEDIEKSVKIWTTFNDNDKRDFISKELGIEAESHTANLIVQIVDNVATKTWTYAEIFQMASIAGCGASKAKELEVLLQTTDDLSAFEEHMNLTKTAQVYKLWSLFEGRIGFTPVAEPVVVDESLPTFSMTGKIVGHTKAELAKLLEDRAVWNDKDYDVMVSDADRMSAKMQKALDAGKKVMKSAEFIEFCGLIDSSAE